MLVVGLWSNLKIRFMKKTFFTYMFVFLFSLISSCNKKKDVSEKIVSKNPKIVNVEIDSLQKLEKKYYSINIDSAVYFNEKVEKLLNKSNVDSLKYNCFFEFIKIHQRKEDFKQALFYCKKAMAIAIKNKNLQQQVANYRAFSILYKNIDSLKLAIDYGQKSLQLATKINDTLNTPLIYASLSSLYTYLEMKNKAIEYGYKGIELSEKYKNDFGLVLSLNNTATALLEKNENLQAEKLLLRELELATKIDRAVSIRFAYYNLGLIYYESGEKQKLEKISKAFTLFNKEDTNWNKNEKTLELEINGYSNMLNNKLILAEQNFNQALILSKDVFELDEIGSMYENLTYVKYAQNDYNQAIKYKSLMLKLYDSSRTEKMSKYQTDLETKYQTKEKEAQIKIQQAQLEKRKTINYSLIGTLLAFLLIAFLTYKNYKQKQIVQQQKITELETEKQLTATEAVLKGEDQERSRIAKDLHDGLGGMLSGIKYSFTSMKGNLIMTEDNALAFDKSLGMLDNSISEMRRVAHNMMPEALLRFGLDAALKDYCTENNNSQTKTIYQSVGLETLNLEQSKTIGIYRIVQELLNNALKHANATQIMVQLFHENNSIVINVEDNGKGFDKSILSTKKGIGWENVQSRVDYLKGKLDLDSEINKGTSVHIEINL